MRQNHSVSGTLLSPIQNVCAAPRHPGVSQTSSNASFEFELHSPQNQSSISSSESSSASSFSDVDVRATATVQGNSRVLSHKNSEIATFNFD